MSNPTTKCSVCGTSILQKTFEATGGKCIPCNGSIPGELTKDGKSEIYGKRTGFGPLYANLLPWLIIMVIGWIFVYFLYQAREKLKEQKKK